MDTVWANLRKSTDPVLHDTAVRYLRTGDDRYLERFLDAAEPIIRYVLTWQRDRLYHMKVDDDDLYQLARIAVAKAFSHINPDLLGQTSLSAFLVKFIKRNVYNDVLDTLGVPRAVSKQLHQALRHDPDPEHLPPNLRGAYMLRSTVLIDSSWIIKPLRIDVAGPDRYQATLPEASRDIETIRNLVGAETFEDLLDVVTRKRCAGKIARIREVIIGISPSNAEEKEILNRTRQRRCRARARSSHSQNASCEVLLSWGRPVGPERSALQGKHRDQAAVG